MSSIWSALYNIPCGVWRYNGINDTGDAEYIPSLDDNPHQIMIRVDYSRREVLDKAGNRVISEATIYTEAVLKALDKVIVDGNTWTVKSVEPIRDLMGQIDHYEVTL